MYKKRRSVFVLIGLIGLILLISAFTLAGCSADQSKTSEEAQSADSSKSGVSYSSQEKADGQAEQGQKVLNPGTTGVARSGMKRMVIYNAHMSAEVADYSKARNQVEQLVQQFGGYIVQSSEYRTEKERGGNLILRIPQGGFTSFIQKVEEISLSIPNRNIEGNDVTEEYVDLASRLKAKQTMESRLLDFMNKAEKVEDLLKISEDLGRVQQEIEQIKGRMRYLEENTAFSTVQLTLIEKKTTVAAPDSGTMQQAWYSFIRSTGSLVTFLTEAIIFLSGSLPFLFVIGLIAVPVWLFVRRFRRNNNAPTDKDVSDQ